MRGTVHGHLGDVHDGAWAPHAVSQAALIVKSRYGNSSVASDSPCKAARPFPVPFQQFEEQESHMGIPKRSEEDIEGVMRSQLPVWDELASTEKAMVLQTASFHSYETGQVVQYGGNDCVGVIFLLSGELRASMTAQNGRSISLFHIFPNENCVLSASCALLSIDFDICIDVLADSELLVIPSDVFQSLMQNVQVKAYSYEQTALRFSEVMWVFYQVLFVSFDKRLANFLLEAAEPDEADGTLVVRRTHEQIASELGSAREVVSRMLKYFSQEGLVELSRGMIKLVDTASLSDLARSE
jgi:CRP/FNR family transcriptional regulator